MGHVKPVVLTAVVALAMMGIGASATMATELCKSNVNTGACLEPYAGETVIDASLSERSVLETLGGTVIDECGGSTFKGKTTNTGRSIETVSAKLETVTWSECTKLTPTVATGALEFHWISGTDNATLTGRETEWTNNFFFGSCTYGFTSAIDLGVVSGGSPAEISINTILPKISGSASCAAETRWTAKYRFTEPNPLYFSAGRNSGVLCKANTSTTSCPEPYSASQSVEASLKKETTAVLETLGGTVLDTCTGTTLKGEVTSAGSSTGSAKAGVEELAWSGCTKTTDTLKAGSLEFHWILGTDNGTLTASGTEWTTNTIFGSCTYGFGTSTDLGTVTGGSPATISVNAVIPKTGGGGLCPTEARWTATYTFTAPMPLYFAAG